MTWDVDGYNEYHRRIHEREMRCLTEGRCRFCGGLFLKGLEDAEICDGPSFFYLCFFCADKDGDDPSDPRPSMFHYGNC